MNVSSEAPDPLLFAGFAYPTFNPYKIPTLGGGPVTEATDYSNVTWSSISQEMADLTAQLNAMFETAPAGPEPPPTSDNPAGDPWVIPPPFPGDPTQVPAAAVPDLIEPTFIEKPPGWINPDTGSYQQYTNDTQSATAVCPNGGVFSCSVPSGTIVSGLLSPEIGAAWVARVNAIAYAWALQKATALRFCISVPWLESPTGVAPDWWPEDEEWPVDTDTYPQDSKNTPRWAKTGQGTQLVDNPAFSCSGSPLDSKLCRYEVAGQGNANFDFSIVGGEIPPGTELVALDDRTAVLQGTPITPGTYEFTVRAARRDLPSLFTDINDSLSIMGLESSSLAAGTEGESYSAQLIASGGTTPITFSGASGLPAGLTVSSTGLVSGTPTDNGSFTITVSLTDAEGWTCNQSISLTVAEAEVPAGPGPDWASLVWTEDFINGDMDRIFNGPGFYLEGVSTDPEGLDVAQLVYTGTVTYNGPEAHCNLHLDGTATIVPFIGDPYSRVAISITNDDWSLHLVTGISEPQIDPTDLPSGTYDIPFTVPDTGGLDVLLTVYVLANAGYNVSWGGGTIEGGSGTVEATALITNV